MSTQNISKIYSILEKIEYIEQNIHSSGSIYHALSDQATARPAILMLLTGVAEQFIKLKQHQDTKLLSFFAEEELKGMQDIRNFIAHDYDGIELSIIEWLLHNALPKLKVQCQTIISLYKDIQ
ncbi:MAG: DUF86 domain-containing protein [Sulfurovum sp.]|nr:DUF86 domain-containing protein [Sulfurovum sp.]